MAVLGQRLSRGGVAGVTEAKGGIGESRDRAYHETKRWCGMTSAKLFLEGDAQALQLPKSVEFPAGVTDVVIRRVGRTLVISPAKSVWDDFFDEPGIDLGERAQPPSQTRESL